MQLFMRTVLNIQTDTADKLNLLIRVAEEMGMEVEQELAIDLVALASQDSLAEAWNSPEDAHWDKVATHVKK